MSYFMFFFTHFTAQKVKVVLNQLRSGQDNNDFEIQEKNMQQNKNINILGI